MEDSPVGMVDPLATILQQTTDILHARLIRVVVPRPRATVRCRVRQIQRRNHVVLIRQVADKVVPTEVIAVWCDKMVVGQVELLGNTKGIVTLRIISRTPSK